MRQISTLFCFSFLSIFFTSTLFSTETLKKTPRPKTVFDYTVKDIDSKDVKMTAFHGKVMLIVNTASKCGYTPQYKDLQAIQEKYSPLGFTVLAFPSNDFGGQEPGTEHEIKKFCELNYKVNFPMFKKGPVSGPQKQELFKYLTEEAHPDKKAEISWNFEKFLIARNGKLLSRFSSKVSPSDSKITAAIENAIAE